ncbi:Acyl-CoA binding domain containing 5 [Perkinsus olseni]|uniref:Acyl-CoA binding domain containing 5 n=1 Tax=Perkinsus olseni TaxID=32597 RepID=A0A7J6PME8_PEROL|nr:Acyl-CoA binding domain containing 5 [Perkinsus olseni]
MASDPTTEKDFNAAVAYVRGLPKGKSPISTSKQLDFYSRFKQATIGTCVEHGGSQPWAVQVEARAKWDAWKKLGDMSRDEAMKEYVSMLTEVSPKWREGIN